MKAFGFVAGAGLVFLVLWGLSVVTRPPDPVNLEPRYDSVFKEYLNVVYGTPTPMRLPSENDWMAMRQLSVESLPSPPSPMDVAALMVRFYHLECFGTPWMPAEHDITNADRVAYLRILHEVGIIREVPHGHEESLSFELGLSS